MSENLWLFATRLYAEPDIAAHCLAWQEQFGADVDMLLAGCWLAARQRVWAGTGVLALERHCEVWRSNAVLPLRAVRRALVPSNLYPMLKAVELAAERTQLDIIARWLDRHVPATLDLSPSVCVERNLACYAQHRGIDPGGGATQALVRSWAPLLVAACA